MTLGIRPFEHGLHDVGAGCYAWIQPDGGWGWSNAGLVVDGDESLLVDTLFDLKLTRAMLDGMRLRRTRSRTQVRQAGQYPRRPGPLQRQRAGGGGGDHRVQRGRPWRWPPRVRTDSPRSCVRPPPWAETGRFVIEAFSAFDFEGITRTLPTTTFEGEYETHVGDKRVALKQVGPCHTTGDILVHVPGEKLIFTGDIVFVEGHPILWVGPVANWIAACDHILKLPVEIIVPGHGPITDKRGVQAVRDYLVYVRDEARARFDAGLSVFDAAMDISLADFESWGEAERIVVNVETLYREFGSTGQSGDPIELMARIRKERA